MSNPGLFKNAFVSFYSDLLYTTLLNRHKVNMNVISASPNLIANMRDSLDLSFSTEDIKKAMWSLDGNKAPGLDGYNSKFYKSAWSMVGPDIVEVVQLFFSIGKLLKA